MFTKSKLALAVVAVLSVSDEALGRIRWMERDNRAVHLHPRRFGQENPEVIQKLSSACEGGVCGTLAGAAITPLLAAQPECSQQDMADQIIDAAQKFDAATKAKMIALAVEYRKAEKNTPPASRKKDFTTNPPTPRNSVFCQKAPKNAELNGLVQAQDPANGDLFFDPATKASVQRGSQPNTAPFGQAGGNGAKNSTATGNTAAKSKNNAAATGANNGTADGGIGNFGSCSVPQVEFGVGFENRKETSFQPVDKKSFNHGSAQNFGIISQFICDTLTNSCGADQTAKDTCKKATTAANGAAAKTGAQADAFNAAFGKKTNFAAVQAIDNQGKPVPGTGAGTGANTGNTGTGGNGNGNGTTGNNGNTAAGKGNGNAAGGIGNFGSCSVPEVEFGVGFDNRKETSFQPVDKKSFNHGSAQGFAIISQFICDTLTNSCGADQTAKDTCKKATTAAIGAAAKTGAQADAFNAAFGKKTNFAAVQAIDDQGRPVGGK
ncbi:hypothetical protein L218DRAFT_854619 [Marasmius fiardii PR-910]|nr:hypothetical protein L218DRAFT_854619 [Marasmius fiardii PR-910]